MSIQQTKTLGAWLPLMDYAIKKEISVSTLRRHIRSNKLVYKKENGRYLLYDADSSQGMNLIHNSSLDTREKPPYESENHLQKLQQDLKIAHEEIAELKTLIAFYEEKIL